VLAKRVAVSELYKRISTQAMFDRAKAHKRPPAVPAKPNPPEEDVPKSDTAMKDYKDTAAMASGQYNFELPGAPVEDPSFAKAFAGSAFSVNREGLKSAAGRGTPGVDLADASTLLQDLNPYDGNKPIRRNVSTSHKGRKAMNRGNKQGKRTVPGIFPPDGRGVGVGVSGDELPVEPVRLTAEALEKVGVQSKAEILIVGGFAVKSAAKTVEVSEKEVMNTTKAGDGELRDTVKRSEPGEKGIGEDDAQIISSASYDQDANLSSPRGHVRFKTRNSVGDSNMVMGIKQVGQIDIGDDLPEPSAMSPSLNRRASESPRVLCSESLVLVFLVDINTHRFAVPCPQESVGSENPIDRSLSQEDEEAQAKLKKKLVPPPVVSRILELKALQEFRQQHEVNEYESMLEEIKNSKDPTDTLKRLKRCDKLGLTIECDEVGELWMILNNENSHLHFIFFARI